MTSQNGRAFNEWLRAQLKAKKMSQRQLAQQSGVDHSTISRLIRGDRMPSLGTATKLARGLRELREDADTAQYLGLVTAGATNPTARVEYALRADELLSEPQVRQIMEYYLAVRMRRFGRAFQPTRRPRSARQTVPPRDRSRPSAAPSLPASARRQHECQALARSDDRWAVRVARSGHTTAFTSGLDPDRPPRPGLGDSEGRRLGRRPSRFPQEMTAVAPERRWRVGACAPRSRADGARSLRCSAPPCQPPCATTAVTLSGKPRSSGLGRLRSGRAGERLPRYQCVLGRPSTRRLKSGVEQRVAHDDMACPHSVTGRVHREEYRGSGDDEREAEGIA